MEGKGLLRTGIAGAVLATLLCVTPVLAVVACIATSRGPSFS